jgi:hypothetical protein
VRRTLIALGTLILVVAAAAIAYLNGVGPLAPPTAPRSVVFVAISRSTDETDAHEIEAIDLDAGTRSLFDAGGRITAMALSPDRRSLYVALDGGKVVLLDAMTGSQFGAIDLAGPTVVSLAPTPDGRTLFAIAVTNIQSAVVPIDLATKKAGDPLTFPLTAGAAIIRGDTLIVPLGVGSELQVAFIDVGTRTLTSRLVLPRGSLIPAAAFRISGTQTGIVAFDGGLGRGAVGLRLYLVTDPLHWSDLVLQAPFPQGLSRRQVSIGLQVVTSAEGTIHVCSIAGDAGLHYIVVDLKVTTVRTECGPLAGGEEILMARRDPAQLLVLEDKTGKIVRTLPLAGVPARLAH